MIHGMNIDEMPVCIHGVCAYCRRVVSGCQRVRNGDVLGHTQEDTILKNSDIYHRM